MNVKQTTSDFEFSITIRADILRNLSTNYIYAKCLYNIEFERTLNKHWLHIRHVLFQFLILDLVKLFSNNINTHKMNFFKLLEQLKSGKYRVLKMPFERIEFYKYKLDNFNSTLIGLIRIRDGYIAHTERLAGIGPNVSFFPTVRELIDFGFELLHECSMTILQKPVINNIDKIDLTDFVIE